MNDQPEVLVRVQKNVGRITLNRPQALHALTQNMCELMIAALLDWQDDPEIYMVIIDHAGERGFCAGGDIRMLAHSGAGDAVEARAFFHTEYQLNHLLFTYDTPVVAILDGVVMGGGVGISMPAHFRIATERTTFAMPETGIGLFPDVGGGWYLPRLPGKAGLWLALTGARIKGADCLRLGIATHFVEFGAVEGLKKAIVADPRRIEETLKKYRADAGKAAGQLRAGPQPPVRRRQRRADLRVPGGRQQRLGQGPTGCDEDQVAPDPESRFPSAGGGGGDDRLRRQHCHGIPDRLAGGAPPRLHRGRPRGDHRQGQRAPLGPGHARRRHRRHAG